MKNFANNREFNISSSNENKTLLNLPESPADADDMVFADQAEAMQTFKKYKDARFKKFASRDEALKFARNETNPITTASMLESFLKCKFRSTPL